MDTAATYATEHPWIRRCSTETVLSIQGQETDIARDTSDTEPASSDEDVEYEPASEPEDSAPFDTDDTGISDNEIISTKVIEVSVGDDGDLVFADSEPTESQGSDSEIDFHDYWRCAQCRAKNNNPLFRYCEKCFTTRKHFFPPRPKRKLKRVKDVPRTLSQDSGVDTHLSQPSSQEADQGTSLNRKRRAESLDRNPRNPKEPKLDSHDSDTDDEPVQTLVKTVSDPSITIDDVKITKKVIASTLKDKVGKDTSDLCVVCITEPKSGVFVHGRIAHICCCYKCALKVWSTAKRCPVCNCKVSNVLKAVVM